MAFDKKQDSGELTPFSDNVMFRNRNSASGTSVTVNFPNTPRKKKEAELYDLSKNFHSITGHDYKSSSSLLTFVRVNELPTGPFDLVSGTSFSVIMAPTSEEISNASPFVPRPGYTFSQAPHSIIVDGGSNGFLFAPGTAIFSPASYGGIFSITLWVYFDEIKDQTLVHKNSDFSLILNSDGNIEFEIQDSGTELINIKSSKVILPKTWTHITLNSSADFTSSLDSSTVKLYINAKKDNNTDVTVSSSWTSLAAKTSNMSIGLGPFGDLSGMITEFAMWSTHLDETEIIAIYDSSSGLSNKMDTSSIDEYRQGVSILTNKHKYSSLIFKLSSGQQRRNGHPDHFVEQREFGQPKAHVDGIAFNDIEGKFKPFVWNETDDIKIINNEDTMQYPVVYSENLTDPSVFDGVIEPLVIRRAITNNSIDAPFHAHDIRGSVMGGNNNPLLGDELVTSDIKLKENIKQDSVTGAMINYSPFYDSDEIGMEIESSGILVHSPGYITDTRNTEVVFNDNELSPAAVLALPDWHVGLPDEIAPGTLRLGTTVTIEQAKDKQRYNHLIKSAPAGFVYSGAAVTGTDSLAFGGLTRK